MPGSSARVDPRQRLPGLPSVSTVLVRPLELALAGHPEAIARLHAAADLTPRIIADPDARLSPAQFCVAWATAIQLTGNPSLALDIAEATPAGAFGVVEYVCRSTANLGEALEQWCRYLGILDDALEVRLVREADHAFLRVCRESEAPAPAAHELCFALVVRNAARMVTGFSVAEVRFTHRVTPPHAERLRSFFGAPILLGAPCTELVLDRASLAAPLSSADANLLAVLVPVAEQRRREPPHPPVTGRVRHALGNALSTDAAQLEAVAKALGTTARSLQRDLREEHTTFQELRDQVRQELADRYIGQGLSLAETSFLLGFSEPSAFFRAFKRWTGVTPLVRRASLTSG